MIRFLKIFLPIVLISIFTQCGRKNSAFLNFEEKKDSVKINKLTLPSVRGLTIEKDSKNTVLLQWQYIKNKESIDKDRVLVGYNIYKFIRTAFIPKNPINNFIVTENKYMDSYKQKKVSTCYVVRAVFKIKDKNFEGPSSQVVCID